jgi:glycosyltransferase involved in cell wall biosynthesis
MDPELSIVVPAYNERDSLPALLDEIDAVAAGYDGCEVIVVDDGSDDGTDDYLAAARSEHPALVPLRLTANLGKSAALAAGFARSRGRIVVTLDGDGQDDPAEIPLLAGKIEEGYDLVSGWKQDRQDTRSRRSASRLFNRTTAVVSGVELHDFNCGLKAYRGELIRSLDIYGELHRFIPVLGRQRGWRITEVPVANRPRLHGTTKFGIERYARGLLDLMAVVFMGRYENRPLHLFGGVGLIAIALGVILGVYLTIEKIGGEAIGGRPLLLLSVLLIVVGIQFVTFGLISQMLVSMRHSQSPSPLPFGVVRELGEGGETEPH